MTVYEGVLGDAMRASVAQRLKMLIRDENSEALQMFHPYARESAVSGDWLGEHTGKWLCAASLAAHRTGDLALIAVVSQACDLLLEYQEPDGYLGTYSRDSEARFTHARASTVRTWDIWIHSWILLGLLAAHELLRRDDVLESAQKVGDLMIARFSGCALDLVSIGNHRGLSSASIVHPLAELSSRTSDAKYANLAAEILGALEDFGSMILLGPEKDMDVSEIGTGKIYQICWVLLGMVRLAEAQNRPELLKMAEYWWANISDHHLTPLGGPWGGIGAHKEVFNPAGFFDQEGLTETCAAVTWISLCRELYRITSNRIYSDAAELAVHNALLGAMDPNGEDWCYFTFPNGRRNNTYFWACCKSSGALGLEEITLWENCRSDTAQIFFWENQVTSDGEVRVSRKTGDIWVLTIENVSDHERVVNVRIPVWAELITSDSRAEWYPITLPPGQSTELCARVRLKVTSYRSITDHHGQVIQSHDYICVSLGPYVYAAGLIDGYKTSDVFRVAKLFPENSFRVEYENSPDDLANIWLLEPGRNPVLMRPYYQAGGRHDSAWRATWLEVAWQ